MDFTLGRQVLIKRSNGKYLVVFGFFERSSVVCQRTFPQADWITVGNEEPGCETARL